MDAQHSFMFGHTFVLSVHDVRLPLPCAESLWDCDNPEEWSRMLCKYPEPLGFLPVLKGLLAQTPLPPWCSDFGRLNPPARAVQRNGPFEREGFGYLGCGTGVISKFSPYWPDG
jgi:hypothetical protein